MISLSLSLLHPSFFPTLQDWNSRASLDPSASRRTREVSSMGFADASRLRNRRVCFYENWEDIVRENRVRSRVFRRFELPRTQPFLCSVAQFGRRSFLDKNEPHLKHPGMLSFNNWPTPGRLRFPHLRLNSANRPDRFFPTSPWFQLLRGDGFLSDAPGAWIKLVVVVSDFRWYDCSFCATGQPAPPLCTTRDCFCSTRGIGTEAHARGKVWP